ncbi:copper resistance CopC/CopD family protein [Streptomyces sp. NPDC059786]|uniref:copper resistance CopC/CopD family protein n=1 Tax=Streptomyces sp. NPDC059786 TaxID=3346946 RepID=UPI00364CF203
MRTAASRLLAVRGRTAVLLLLAVLGALLAGAGPASAHAALTGSDPQQGVVVDKAPTDVSLTFSENVAMSDDSLRVLDPQGKRVDTGKNSAVGGATYRVPLHSGLPDGTYTVTYQVVSADSHPVSGAFTFSIGAPSATAASVPDQAAGGGFVGGLYGFARYVSYAGFILLAGGAAFVLGCWQRGAGVRPVQRLVVGGWLALTAATLALLFLRGAYTGSGKAADIFDLSLLGQVLQTKTGAALVSRLLLLAAAALFISVLFGAYVKRDGAVDEVTGDGAAEGRPPADGATAGRAAADGAAADGAVKAAGDGDGDSGDAAELAAERRDLTFGLSIGGIVVAAGLAASWSMAEHASVGIQPGIAMPVDVLHLLAVAAWLGGLCTLLVALYRAPAGQAVEAAAVRRFSRVAFGSVVTLAVTGLYQSWRQVGSWSALTGTRYGQLLLVKVGLVVLLVGIAYVSRRWTGRLSEAAAGRTAESVTAPADGNAGVRVDGNVTVPVKQRTSKPPKKRVAKLAQQRVPEPVKQRVAEPVKQQVAEKEPAAVSAGAGSADPRRAAQLARQRAAVATAREKRIRDADPHRSGLRRSVLAEAGVAVVLLAVTTVLTSTEPGRTQEEAAAATASAPQRSGPLSLTVPFDTGGEDGKGTVRLSLDPARVGGNDLHLFVERPNGKAFDVPEVKLAFTLKAKDLGPLPVLPDHIATGHWTATGVQIPMAGDWKIAVTVRTSDIDQTTVTKNAKIG